MQERLDPLWSEESGQYRPGPGGVDALVNSLMLLTHSVAAQQGHTGASRNDHRARLIARALVSPPVFIERPSRPSRRRLADARPRLDELDVERRRRPAPRLRRRDRRRPRPRVEGSARARPVRRDGGEDRRPHPPRGVVALLALADHPPQPGQLVRAHVRGRRDRDGALPPAAARPPRAARPLRRERRPLPERRRGQLRRRAALPLPAGPRAQRPRQPRLGRVREHRALLPALLRPGAPRRHGSALTRGPRARPALGTARDRRLLDPRRLPQLGHRPRVRALAPGEEARASPSRR